MARSELFPSRGWNAKEILALNVALNAAILLRVVYRLFVQL